MLKNDTLKSLLSNSIYSKFYIFDTISSTNTEALNGNYEDFSVLIAKKQTSGKGRSGRKWLSEEGNLLFSIIIPQMDISKLLPLNIVSGYAVCDALRRYAPVNLKWPNDIVINNKKLGGILTESKFSGINLEKIVVGIGINVNQKYFDEEIKEIATSLSIEKSQDFNLEDLLANILIEFEKYYSDLVKNRIDIIEKWCKYSNNFGKQIKIHLDGKKVEFVEKGITEYGELLVLDNNGKERKIIVGDIYL